MMADERDFELLDDYLSNRMVEEDRGTFSQKLQADPDLQHEYALQKQLIRGIKNARAAELKAMLNKVVVPPHNPGATLISKVALTAVASLVIAGAGYWYFSQEETPTTPPPTVTNTIVTPEQPSPNVEAPAASETETAQPEAKQPITRPSPEATGKNQTSAGTEHSKPSLAKQPEPLQIPSPPGRTNNAASSENNVADASSEDASLVIETHPEHAEYNFHYQYADGKLALFGPFGTAQYETVELLMNGSYAKFLYYNDAYYALEKTGADIQPLKPVTDPDILKRLSEIRQAQ